VARKYGGGKDSETVRKNARNQVVADMERDGYILISRLEANSPIPFQFKQKISLCYQRKSSEFTHFNNKSGKDNAMAKGIHDWIEALPARARLILLMRGPDGHTVDTYSLLTFLEMFEDIQDGHATPSSAGP
jgi:hypothetical protein